MKMGRLHRTLLGGGTDSAPRAAMLTSMIDIVFLLMIFFLFGRFRLHEGQLLAGLVRPGQSVASRDEQVVWVTVRRDGGAVRFAVNDAPPVGNPRSLAARLADTMRDAEPGRVRLIVDPQPGSQFEDLMAVWDAGLSLGVSRIGLRAQPPPGSPGGVP